MTEPEQRLRLLQARDLELRRQAEHATGAQRATIAQALAEVFQRQADAQAALMQKARPRRRGFWFRRRRS
jgi:hypothetical protein